MNRLRTTQLLMVALLFLAGCATTAPPAEKTAVLTKPPAAPAEKQVTPPRLTEDSDLFAEGLALLNLPDRTDSAKARAVFVSLLERYPQSTWRLAAETFIRLSDEIAALQEENRRDRLLAEQALAEQIRTERVVAMQENEALQRKLREQTEKLQKETMSLAQENEKLRKDLQRLKALEIELEKRERMLR
jgi:hypothetical protein